MKKVLSFLTLALLFPVSVYASWWNPTTWKIFTRQDKQVVQKLQESNNATQLDQVTLESTLLSCNGSKYNKCPEGQTFVCPISGEDAFCDKIKTEEVKTPKTKEITVQKNQIKQELKTGTSLKSNNNIVATNVSKPDVNKQAIPKPDVLGEENDNRVKIMNLYTLLISMIDSKIEINKLDKKSYEVSKRVWSDELTRTETYLQSFPDDPYLIRDGKVYRIQLGIIEDRIKYSENTESKLVEYRATIQNLTELLKNTKLDSSNIESSLSLISKGKDYIELLGKNIESSFKRYDDGEHDLIVKMDALHAAEKAKISYDAADLEAKKAEIARLRQSIDRNVQQAVDAYNNSKPINCTSRSNGYGGYEVSCK